MESDMLRALGPYRNLANFKATPSTVAVPKPQLNLENLHKKQKPLETQKNRRNEIESRRKEKREAEIGKRRGLVMETETEKKKTEVDQRKAQLMKWKEERAAAKAGTSRGVVQANKVPNKAPITTPNITKKPPVPPPAKVIKPAAPATKVTKPAAPVTKVIKPAAPPPKAVPPPNPNRRVTRQMVKENEPVKNKNQVLKPTVSSVSTATDPIKKKKAHGLDDVYIDYMFQFSTACVKLNALYKTWTEKLDHVPEEDKENILSALGKAKLLLQSKLPQFSELLHSYVTKETDPVVLECDLGGWWDVACISIGNVVKEFEGLQ